MEVASKSRLEHEHKAKELYGKYNCKVDDLIVSDIENCKCCGGADVNEYCMCPPMALYPGSGRQS